MGPVIQMWLYLMGTTATLHRLAPAEATDCAALTEGCQRVRCSVPALLEVPLTMRQLLFYVLPP